MFVPMLRKAPWQIRVRPWLSSCMVHHGVSPDHEPESQRVAGFH